MLGSAVSMASGVAWSLMGLSVIGWASSVSLDKEEVGSAAAAKGWSGGVVGVEAALVWLVALAEESSAGVGAGAGGVCSAGVAAGEEEDDDVCSGVGEAGAADRGRNDGTNSMAFMLSVENVPPRSPLPSCAMSSASLGTSVW